MFEFEYEIDDGVITVVVSHVFIKEHHAGSQWTCDSKDDYYGYTEIEFDCYTDMGNEFVITDDSEIEKIEEEIIKRYKADEADARLEAQLEAAYF